MSELQLTAPANAGVQKAESVCKPWRLSVSELHTYFVEKRYIKFVADRVVQDRFVCRVRAAAIGFPESFLVRAAAPTLYWAIENLSCPPTVPCSDGRSLSLLQKLIRESGRPSTPLDRSVCFRSYTLPFRRRRGLPQKLICYSERPDPPPTPPLHYDRKQPDLDPKNFSREEKRRGRGVNSAVGAGAGPGPKINLKKSLKPLCYRIYAVII